MFVASLNRAPIASLALCLLITAQSCLAASVDFADAPNVDIASGKHAQALNGSPAFTQKLRSADSDVESAVSEGNEKVKVPEVVVRKAEFLSSVSEDVDLSSANLPVFFSISEGVEGVEDVTVVGSWSKWLEHFKLRKHKHEFNGFIPIPPGKYQFKFILDGRWTTSNEWEVVEDQDGNLNNVITVSKELVQESEARRAAAEEEEYAVEREETEAAESKRIKNKPLWKRVVTLLLLPFKSFFRVLLTPVLILQGLLFGRD
mmetsp:Transcript_6087/g.14047  ORF Transcript_6087/g.14047 Transcript_6087/m.14047 type:complete len:260 (-) Transcript_6087:83-862(-)|eukprot:753741-Hanusia_phi.AAC.2